MQSTEIDAQLRQRPFSPFRIHLSDGSRYDVRHPEMLLVSRRSLALTIFSRPEAKLAERIVLCDPMHVTRIEQLNGEDE